VLSSEQDITDFWKRKKVYDKVKSVRKKGKKFYFLDGPPYATGSIHIGTAQNKVLKDCHRRFLRMRGFDVWDQPGFDTHGLPIENKVEQKLGFKNKKEIEAFGVGKFVDECRSFATQHIGTMTQQFDNMGIWMDWKNPYLTLDNSYIEGAWLTFKRGFEEGLLYKGNYPVHVCPHCGTAVAYNEIEHQKTRDPSLFVKFCVKGRENEYLIVWTTTPWTLPANVAIMANPEAEYVKVGVGGEVYILSSRLLVKVMETVGIKEYRILENVKGSDLKGLEYEHPMTDIFTFQKNMKGAHRIVLSDYVTLEDGSGLVHTAPGHGQEDWRVGQENGLPSVCPVKMDGTFDETCGPYSGIPIKKANSMIIEEMRSRGLLLKDGMVEHEYPFCWRCGSALLLIAVPQWFFRVTEMRAKLLRENDRIKWYPRWAGDRFRNWLESLGDWPVSRQRYWGIPLPIWECGKCGSAKVVGSAKELGRKIKDLHRPVIDSVVLKCSKCRSDMRRVPDVMDVWFDSGVAAWASLGYPSENKLMKRMWPADLVVEGPDQIRGWWNSMLISGVMTFGESPFRRVLFHGFVLDNHGIKMSKSKGNFVSPEDVIAKHGRDVLRCYFLYQVPWEDSYFKWEDVSEIGRSLMVVRNIFNFAKTYVLSPGKSTGLKVEDRWILSRLNSVIASSTENMESFNSHKAVREIVDFLLNDFSRWYIKIVRDRVWVGYKGKDREAAFYVMYTVLRESAKLLAPFVPFLAEEVYQNVVLPIKKSKLSVHMEDWPKVQKRCIDLGLEREMAIAQKVFEASLAARQKAGIKLRWPVRSIVVKSDDKGVAAAVKTASDILKSMCNAKIVAVVRKEPKGNFVQNNFDHGTLFLDREQDDWTRREAMFRELVRFVQEMRKQNRFNVNESVRLTISSDSETLKKLSEYKNAIVHEVGAKSVEFGSLRGEFSSEMNFEGVKIGVAFDRVQDS